MHYCPPQSNFRGGRVPRGIYATGTGHYWIFTRSTTTNSHTVTAFRSRTSIRLSRDITLFLFTLLLVTLWFHCYFLFLLYCNNRGEVMACMLAYIYTQLLLITSCGLVLGTFGEFSSSSSWFLILPIRAEFQTGSSTTSRYNRNT